MLQYFKQLRDDGLVVCCFNFLHLHWIGGRHTGETSDVGLYKV